MDSYSAVCQSIGNKLVNSNVLWSDRVYLDEAPIQVNGIAINKPYIIYSFVSGGNTQKTKQIYDMYRFQVAIYSTSKTTAITGNQDIVNLLENKGVLDYPNDPMPKIDRFVITTIHRLEHISDIDHVQGSYQVYREGDNYEITVQTV